MLSIRSKIEKLSLQSQDYPICGENLFFFCGFQLNLAARLHVSEEKDYQIAAKTFYFLLLT